MKMLLWVIIGGGIAYILLSNSANAGGGGISFFRKATPAPTAAPPSGPDMSDPSSYIPAYVDQASSFLTMPFGNSGYSILDNITSAMSSSGDNSGD